MSAAPEVRIWPDTARCRSAYQSYVADESSSSALLTRAASAARFVTSNCSSRRETCHLAVCSDTPSECAISLFVSPLAIRRQISS